MPGRCLDARRAWVREVPQLVRELGREIVGIASGQDLTLAGAAAVISALIDPEGTDPDVRDTARAWLRAWESLR